MNYLKKLLYLLMCVSIVTFTACDDDDNEGVKTYDVSIQLVYPEGGELEPIADVAVTLKNANAYVFEATTNANGLATFSVPVGLYEAAATEKRASEGYTYLYNGTKSNILVDKTWDASVAVELELTESKAGQVIIKELYAGGCPTVGTGSFQNDGYVILYNNSDQVATLDNLCLAATTPFTSNGSNSDYDENGKLFYEAEGWVPAGHTLVYYTQTLTIQPYEQVVIATVGAIDHTETYPNSVNLANPAYYCVYEPTVLTHSKYVAPSELIPTSHYFNAYMYGNGNGWASLSINSPAFFIFTTDGISPQNFAAATDNEDIYGGGTGNTFKRKKVPTEWVLDGVEVWRADFDDNTKRLTSNIDGGSVPLYQKAGYTSYRNVDKEATEALEENTGKLVYSYALGTEVSGLISTDPSGIDAEASIKNGAKIIYQDTNNSTNDFHQRARASLRD